MADAQEQAKRQPEVELDLDDVKDTDVTIEETKQEESKEPSLNVGEVDLGYTDHNKDQNKKEVDVIEDDGGAEDKTYENERETKLEQQDDFDDLSKVSDAVKKRIDKLTRKYREAERREKAALDFAKGLQKKYDDSQTKYDSADEKYLKEFDARVDAQREQVKRKLKEAIEANDADAIMQANDELTQLTVEKEKARIKMADREARLKQLEEQKNSVKEEPKYSEQDVVPQEPSSRAKEWAGKNTWFGNDRIMTNAAMTVHEDLVGMGVDVESDEYYNEIDKRMKENFPHRFAVQEQRRPVQKVASAGRTQQGRRSVRLTKSQVAIAKKLGVPLEEYAKFVKEV